MTGATVASGTAPIPTLADAVLDWLIHNAYRIELMGDSLRKQRPVDQSA